MIQNSNFEPNVRFDADKDFDNMTTFSSTIGTSSQKSNGNTSQKEEIKNLINSVIKGLPIMMVAVSNHLKQQREDLASTQAGTSKAKSVLTALQEESMLTASLSDTMESLVGISQVIHTATQIDNNSKQQLRSVVRSAINKVSALKKEIEYDIETQYYTINNSQSFQANEKNQLAIIKDNITKVNNSDQKLNQYKANRSGNNFQQVSQMMKYYIQKLQEKEQSQQLNMAMQMYNIVQNIKQNQTQQTLILQKSFENFDNNIIANMNKIGLHVNAQFNQVLDLNRAQSMDIQLLKSEASELNSLVRTLDKVQNQRFNLISSALTAINSNSQMDRIAQQQKLNIMTMNQMATSQQLRMLSNQISNNQIYDYKNSLEETERLRNQVTTQLAIISQVNAEKAELQRQINARMSAQVLNGSSQSAFEHERQKVRLLEKISTHEKQIINLEGKILKLDQTIENLQTWKQDSQALTKERELAYRTEKINLNAQLQGNQLKIQNFIQEIARQKKKNSQIEEEYRTKIQKLENAARIAQTSVSVETNKAIKQFKDEISDLKQKLELSKKKAKSNEESLTAEYEENIKKIQERYKNKEKQRVKEVQKYQNENKKIRMQLKAQEEKFTKEIAEIEKSNQSQESKIQQAKALYQKKYQKEVQELKQKLKKAEQNTMKAGKQHAQKIISQKHKEIQQMSDKIYEINTQNRKQKDEIMKLKSQAITIANTIKLKDEQITDLKKTIKQIEQFKKKIQQQKQQIDKLMISITQKEDSIKNIVLKMNPLQKALKDMVNKEKEMEKKIKVLIQQLDARIGQTKVQDQKVEQLLEQRNKIIEQKQRTIVDLIAKLDKDSKGTHNHYEQVISESNGKLFDLDLYIKRMEEFEKKVIEQINQQQAMFLPDFYERGNNLQKINDAVRRLEAVNASLVEKQLQKQNKSLANIIRNQNIIQNVQITKQNQQRIQNNKIIARELKITAIQMTKALEKLKKRHDEQMKMRNKAILTAVKNQKNEPISFLDGASERLDIEFQLATKIQEIKNVEQQLKNLKKILDQIQPPADSFKQLRPIQATYTKEQFKDVLPVIKKNANKNPAGYKKYVLQIMMPANISKSQVKFKLI